MQREYITPAFVTAEDIKQVRDKLNMTQKEFAEFVGVSKPTVERWERKKEGVSGEIALLVTLLSMRPELADEIALPKKKYPLRLWYYYKNIPCTVIDVDDARKKVSIVNYTDNFMFRAFGINERPTYEDYLAFLESRCFPRTRDKMKLQLEEFDLPFYDPFLIIEKTEGRMAEDDFRIRIER